MATSLRQRVPTGRTLPEDAWLRRHHAMIGLLLFEAVALAGFGMAEGYGAVHSAGHAAGLIGVAAAAFALESRRRAASVLMSLGLVTACALLVHIWEGAIEGHFLFFVTIVVLSLYEDWIPFLVAAAYVVIHHGIAGAVDPSAVYNHPDAVAHPWKWAAIHGGFVVAAGLASVAAWRLNETLRAQERESYRRALESEERFRSAFEGAPIGMVLFSFAGGRVRGVIQVNQAMAEMVGRAPERLRASRFGDAVHPDDTVATGEALERLGAGGEETIQHELRYIHSDGRTIWASARVSLLRGDRGEPAYAIAQVEDVTERRRVAEELLHQALHDPLTGLGNRRALLADLDLRLLEATPDRPVLLALFDLDGFKGYNDAHGHPAGDDLLVRLAGRLAAAVAGEATAYHVGGDEFFVLSLPEATDRGAIVERAAASLTERASGLTVTVSHGTVLLPDDAATAIDALRVADRRMYASKTADGRGGALVLRLADRRPRA